MYKSLNPNRNDYGGLMFRQVIKTYLCPSDPSSLNGKCQTTNGGANAWGATNYGANYYVLGNPPTRNVQGAARIPATIPDGTSNTIFFAEVYATCSLRGSLSTTYGSLWADSNSVWRGTFCTNSAVKSPAVTGYPPCFKFQVKPVWSLGCDPSRAQSPHTSGINVGLGDGSVRFVSSGISDLTWARACDPQDGNPLGNDW